MVITALVLVKIVVVCQRCNRYCFLAVGVPESYQSTISVTLRYLTLLVEIVDVCQRCDPLLAVSVPESYPSTIPASLHRLNHNH